MRGYRLTDLEVFMLRLVVVLVDRASYPYGFFVCISAHEVLRQHFTSEKRGARKRRQCLFEC